MKSKTNKEFLIFFFLLVCVLASFIVIYCRIYNTSGTSMEPTIKDGGKVLVFKKREIKRGDIIVYKDEDSDTIKRVIGLPGDKIEITEEGEVKVNGEKIKEPYIEGKTPPEEQTYPLTVPKGEYFVLGDNRNDSFDSRFVSVSGIKEEDVIGKVIISLAPFKIL